MYDRASWPPRSPHRHLNGYGVPCRGGDVLGRAPGFDEAGELLAVVDQAPRDGVPLVRRLRVGRPLNDGEPDEVVVSDEPPLLPDPMFLPVPHAPDLVISSPP